MQLTTRTPLPARRRTNLADERGFTMVTLMFVVFASFLFVLAAFASADGDIPQTRRDLDRKQAYAAAEAGVNEYLFQLGQNNAYGSDCGAANAPWSGVGADPRTWRNIPQSAAAYAIELLPANGATACNPADPEGSVVDLGTGTFRIRSTGRSRGEKRSIIATFRKKGFLDFLYFTDVEALDPALYNQASPNCGLWRRQGRPASCTNIQFASDDNLEGPFHTNDGILACGSPTFGRTSADQIEVSEGAPGWLSSCGGTQPDFRGTYVPGSPTLTLPQSPAALQSLAAPQYSFTGRTTIRLAGTRMRVTNVAAGLTNFDMPLPSNGVIYVSNGACSGSYMIRDPYPVPARQGCADVTVSGDYSRDLTIATVKDIIVDGDIRRNANAVLGLLAEQYIRVFHPVRNPAGGNGGGGDEDGGGSAYTFCTNDTGTMNDVSIDAAVLALRHSFIVDHYGCGARLGTLTVTGAIAQKFRGPVGRSGSGSSGSGYIKRYVFDDRLKNRAPPGFLAAENAAWRVSRFSEQVPAR